MADNDVKIKISLDGGQEVEVGLRGVGTEAENADTKTSKLASGGLKGVAVAGAAMLAGTVLAGKGLWEIATGAAAAGDRVDEMSQKLGLSNQAFQEWDYILSQNGASIESLRGGMQRLAVGINDARSGAGPAAEAFAKLGISMDELEGQSREQQFETTIRALQGVEDQTTRAALAQDLLGRGATELAPLLNAGAGSIDELRARAQELGLVMSDEAIAAADEFGDSMDTLKRTAEGLRNSLGAQLLPGINEVVGGLSGLLAGTEGAEDRIRSGAETLTGSLDTVLPRILTIFSTILEGVAIIAPQIISSLVGGITANLPTLIGTVSGALVQLVTLLAGQAPMLVTAGAEAIVALANGVGTALPTLIPVVIQGVLGIVQALIGAAPLLLQAGITLLMGLATGILDSIPIIIDMLPALIDGIVAFIETGVPMLLEAGIQLFMGIIEALPEVIDQIVSVLPGMITAIIGAVVGAVPLLVQAGITLLTALVGALPTIITSIVAALPTIITAILSAVLGALPLLVQAGIDLFVALIGALPQIIITIVNALPQIIGAVVNALVGAIPQLIMAGVQILTSLITNLPQIIGTIVAAMPQIITGIVTALGNGIWQVIQVGGNIVRGIWDGISGAAGWLFDQIAGFVDDVMANIASFFGIASPAKRLRDEIGAFIPSGIGVGVTLHAEDAINPITDLNTKMMAEAQKLNTTNSFSNESFFSQGLIPLQATPSSAGPINVEAALDTQALADAFGEAFSSQSGEQVPVTLDRASINALADAVVSGLRADSRKPTNFLG